MSSGITQKEKNKDILLLFGSRATGSFGTDSDYDLLLIYKKKKQQERLLEIINMFNGKVSVDTMSLREYIRCLKIGCPEVLIIDSQARIIQGYKLMRKIRYQKQGITPITISLCLKKANKLLRNADDLIRDNFLREAAHRLMLSAFWFGAALLFSQGIIPKDKKSVFGMLHESFAIPYSLSKKFSNYETADLDEPPKEEVLFYFKRVVTFSRRLRLVTFEAYLNKATIYLKKAKSYFSAHDFDSAVILAHSAVELAVKGFFIKKIQRAPLYLLEAVRKKKFRKVLEDTLGADLLTDLVKLNEIRNSVYHTVYFSNKQDGEFALKVALNVLTKLSK